MPAGAKPGERRGGRGKGVGNVVTAKVKEALLEALNADEGAVAYFKKLKADEPKVFCTLLGKLIPREITGKDETPLFPQYNDLDSLTSRIEACRRIAFAMAKTDHEMGEKEE